jgi:protein-L-isoaspartate(D-aspartate) O-methyltransferase
MSDLADVRRSYARLLAAKADTLDPRIEKAFATVPREAFLGPGPWTVIAGNGLVDTPDADPAHVYRNVLVVLDAEKGINNGEPLLHAMWMDRVAPQPGETVLQIGAGTGYYTALLSLLVVPGGSVVAYEIDTALAACARKNLRPFASAHIVHADATSAPLPAADVIYVNAGVAAPPLAWLEALKPGGRLVFPWRPARRIGLAVALTRTAHGFACDPFMQSWFIACTGVPPGGEASLIPTPDQAARSRALWPISEKQPDATATAIFAQVWFSDRPLPDG